MGKVIEGFRLAIEWTNPYKQPPDGKQKVLVEKYVITSGSCPPIPPDFEAYTVLGSGYNYTSCYVGPPTKKMSQETLAVVRKKRLRRRIEKKYPLLVDFFVSEEIKKKSDYYSGITDPSIEEAADRASAREKDEYEKLLKLGERLER